ncbi:MAG: hypothetical protein C5B49_12075, partial [Bdellovibrio sp.]
MFGINSLKIQERVRRFQVLFAGHAELNLTPNSRSAICRDRQLGSAAATTKMVRQLFTGFFRVADFSISFRGIILS